LDQVDLLRHLVAVLERLDVPYMLVGSLASAAYGEPRMTQDIDVVVDPGEQQVGSYVTRWADAMGLADIWKAILVRLGL